MQEKRWRSCLFVHCRIGSSEIDRLRQSIGLVVHCRIGSSEMFRIKVVDLDVVHCRIGSSENDQGL